MLLVLGALPILYLFVNYDYVVNRIFYVDDLTLERQDHGRDHDRCCCWKRCAACSAGRMPITAVAFLFYGLVIARLEPQRMLDQLYMTTEGIFGIPLSVSATYVLIFVVFGTFMERTGTGQLFMDFATGLTGHHTGGPGKVAVVSSSLFGTISGSAVANVMVTGQISIPLMKRTGFRPEFAGAVEAVASTGGQIMPPIMGAAAFVMAEFLGVLLWPGGDLGDRSGAALLSRLLLGGAFRGQAPRPRRLAALANCPSSARCCAPTVICSSRSPPFWW